LIEYKKYLTQRSKLKRNFFREQRQINLLREAGAIALSKFSFASFYQEEEFKNFVFK